MTNFHETLFPLGISLNAEGGPVRKTEIVTLVSGHEERNAQWANSRRSWNAGYGVKSMADIEKVTAFFEARAGRLYGFRFRDPFDHQSSAYGKAVGPEDQLIGTGDGARLAFDLVKRFQSINDFERFRNTSCWLQKSGKTNSLIKLHAFSGLSNPKA